MSTHLDRIESACKLNDLVSAVRRAFNEIILQMQSQARRYLVVKQLRAQHGDALPQRPKNLERRVVSAAQQLAAADSGTQTLRKHVSELEQQEQDARRRYEEKEALATRLQGQLDGLRDDSVSPIVLANLREKLARAEAEEAKRDTQIERLLAQLKDLERRSYDAATDAKSVSIALERARAGMETRLHAVRNVPQTIQPPACPGRTTNTTSPTFRKLDRTTRSPKAPAQRPHHVGLTLQIPGSAARSPVTSSISTDRLARSASMRIQRSGPVDSSMLSAKNSNRFSMPPTPHNGQSSAIRVTIVSQREVLAADNTQKTREKARQALQALYQPPLTQAVASSLSSLREDDEEDDTVDHEEETLPEFARDLLSQFGKSTDDLATDLHVGDARIRATIERAAAPKPTKPKQLAQPPPVVRPQHERKESRLLKVFGLR